METAADLTRNSLAFGSLEFVWGICGEVSFEVGLDSGKTSTEATEPRLEGFSCAIFKSV